MPKKMLQLSVTEEKRSYQAWKASHRGLDAERPNWQWEDEESKRRREAWDDSLRELRQTEHERRETMTLNERMTEFMNRLATISTLPVDKTQRYGQFGLPRSDELEIAYLAHSEVERHLNGVARGDEASIFHMRELENALDAHIGHGPHTSADVKPLIGAEKDNIVLERYKGLSPEQISQVSPELGSPKVIRHIRRQQGLHVETGHAKVAA